MTLNILKPNKENLQNYLVIGIFLLLLGFYDIFSSTFLNLNITGFLPGVISYFSPLILGVFGLFLIRIEYSGIIILDKINKIKNG